MTAETRTWTGPSAPERLSILHGTESIAIVGASDKPSRASYFVSTYLLSSSPYRVYFVNPALREIMGRPVYPSLADLPETPDDGAWRLRWDSAWERPEPTPPSGGEPADESPASPLPPEQVLTPLSLRLYTT